MLVVMAGEGSAQTGIDMAEDAADGGAQVVAGAGLHGGLEALLADLPLPRQPLLPLILAVHLRAAFLLRRTLLHVVK